MRGSFATAMDVEQVDAAFDQQVEAALEASAADAEKVKLEEQKAADDYKKAVEESLAGAENSAQLAQQVYLLQGLAPGASSSTSGTPVVAPATPSVADAGDVVVVPDGDSPKPTPAATPKEADTAIHLGAPSPQTVDLSTLCQDCKFPLQMRAGIRMLSKKPPQYSCGRCGTKSTNLRRTFGTWPIEEFKGLSEEDKVAYMQNADSSVRALKESLTDILTKRFVEQHKSSLKGQYLPLTVWKTMGWDPDLIEQTADPEDVEESKYGKMYRVKIHETEENKIEEKCRAEVMDVLKKYKKKKSRHETSSDSDSESSSRDRRRRKDKKRRRRQRSRSPERASGAGGQLAGGNPAGVLAGVPPAGLNLSGVLAGSPPAGLNPAGVLGGNPPAGPNPAGVGNLAGVPAGGLLAGGLLTGGPAGGPTASDPKQLKELLKQKAKEEKQKAQAVQKEQKEKARLEEAEKRKAEAALEKAKKVRVAAANKALTKVSSLIIKLEQMVLDPVTQELPRQVLQELKDIKDAATNIKKVAEAHIGGAMQTPDAAATLSDTHVSAIASAATTCLQTAASLTKTMAKRNR